MKILVLVWYIYIYPGPENFVFDNDGNILFKYGDRPVVLILYSVQRCVNHHRDLSNSSPSSLYSLVCDVPRIVPVISSAALY